MNTDDILILGGAGLLLYALSKRVPAKAPPAPAPTDTYKGYTSGGGLEGGWSTLVYGDAIEQQREALFQGDNLTSGVLSDLGITQTIIEDNYANLEAGGAFDLVEAGDPLLTAQINESPWFGGA